MIDTESIKQRLDCREVMRADLGDPARKSGKTWHWLCPFHGDRKTPSLAGYSDGWKCYGCGAHGDAIDWVMQKRNVAFREAADILGAGPLPAGPAPAPQPPAVHHLEPPSDDWQDAAIKAALACCDALWTDAGADALARLRARGLRDDTIQAAWLGYQARAEWTYEGIEYARLFGLVVPRGITIPWQTAGDLWAVNVRRDGGEPKYWMAKGSKRGLYGADNLAGADVAVVCEGELDALLLHQEAGDIAPAVTFGGAESHDLLPWLPWLLRIRRLLIATDADEAGERAAAWWLATTKRARRLLPPGGAKDATDAHLAGADLRGWVSAAMRGERWEGADG